VYRFIQLLQLGDYKSAVSSADDDWILCRVQSWLWNHRSHFGEDAKELDRLAEAMLQEREGNSTWDDFTKAEVSQFTAVWGSIDLSQYGAASRRRRLARDMDLVILAPVGSTGGYFVMSATVLPDALTFVVVRKGSEWKISNHLGSAPPVPGWPPVWWSSSDPAIADLPEA
jgi:hypothetical protein